MEASSTPRPVLIGLTPHLKVAQAVGLPGGRIGLVEEAPVASVGAEDRDVNEDIFACPAGRRSRLRGTRLFSQVSDVSASASGYPLSLDEREWHREANSDILPCATEEPESGVNQRSLGDGRLRDAAAARERGLADAGSGFRIDHVERCP